MVILLLGPAGPNRVRVFGVFGSVELPDGRTDALERALAAHADGYPVARSLKGAIEVTISFE